MGATAVQVVIRHTSGSKTNRLDNRSLEGFEEIRIGRDPSNTIVYDNPNDDGVSRRHAVIRLTDAGSSTFSIEDLGSANGTFVNTKKATGAVELRHGDQVTLGPNGPSFLFQLDPPPEGQMARTRVMDVAPSAKATRVLAATEANLAADTPPGTVFTAATKTSAATSGMAATISAPAKVGIGRETMMLEIAQARRGVKRQSMAALAAVVAVALAGGGYLYWRLQQEQSSRAVAVAELKVKAADASVSTDTIVNDAIAAARKREGMTAQEIVRQFGSTTAQLEVQWRLYDQVTGRPIFLKIVENEGRKYPLFSKNSDGSLSPWLTLDDENRYNRPIEQRLQGTAFVVGEQGYLLTNKHMAAGWRVPFIKETFDIEKAGILVSETGNKRNPRKYEIIDLTQSKYADLLYWIPETGGLIYQSDSIRQIGPGSIPSPNRSDRRDFVGRNDAMSVRFANTRTSISATLVRSSDENDAALIKVDAPFPLQKSELAGKDQKPTAGERVVVLGFPEIAEQRIAISSTIENGVAKTKTEIVPVPYVTEGIVAQAADKIVTDRGQSVFSQYGDLVQLTINSTGAGNSGGPVFDPSGRVVGIFAAAISAGATQSTAAVPIQYGIELLNSQH